MKKRFLFIIIAVLCVFGISACNEKNNNEQNKVQEPQTFTESYVAYIKINPSIQLNYSRKCTKVDANVTNCEDPIVDSYELVNDDAKEIYKDVDLLAGDKDLISVINKICSKAKENGIDIKNIEVKSDWDEMLIFIETAKIEQTANTENNQSVDLNEINFNVDVEQKEEITTNIQTDIQEETKAKEEAEAKAKEEAEKKAKEEAEKLAKEEAETIKLSDNVSYNHSGRGYCCEDCFSDALIKSLRNAKGYVVVSASSSRIDIKYITKLSPDKYNTTTFKGSNLLNKIVNAGGEECGGLGGEAEPLTASVCKEYHLKCK